MSWSSGTNTIQEVDTNKSMTLQMIKLKKQGGGTEYFVRKNDVKLGTKSVTKNGTYKASDEGKYGFSQFSVNVRGAAGSSNSSGKPSGSDVTTTKPGGGLDLDGVTPPGGSGSSVVGTDPTTGNDVAVGVDSNGNLVQTPVPSAIQIVTPPTKTSYVYQETMDYTGIVVAAKKKDGTTFTDARYMNGHIPMQELIFPVDKAPAGGGGGYVVDEYNVFSLPSFIFSKSSSSLFFRYTGTAPKYSNVLYEAGTSILSTYSESYFSGYLGGVFASDSPFNVTMTVINQDGTRTVRTESSEAIAYYGKTVYGYMTGIYYITRYDIGRVMNEKYDLARSYYRMMAWLMIYGDSSFDGGATIPVKWLNPYTGDTHQDTFQITSTPSSGSSSTTTSSNGTEGSGGGGTF